MARLDTVEIDRNGQRVIINKSDFDAGNHKVWGATTTVRPHPADSLESQYEDLYGKKPHHKLKPESIQAAIDEKLEG